jgi:tetrahydrofolate dehydrogenase/cyclohydrolase, NAD(P)-binding domain protein
MAEKIDGKALSAAIRAELKEQVTTCRQKNGREIGLAVVLVGENPASQVYVRNKIKACEEIGIQSYAYYLGEQTGEEELLELVDTLNADSRVHGILVQLPLPKHIDERRVLERIDFRKDVDGFHAVNAGNLMLGNPCLTACTPTGCIELIKSTGIGIEGKHAVVIGRSNIVGKPMALLLLQENATVTVCHSRTKNLPEITRQADILVVAIGRAKFVTPDMVKPGAVVIDVGMNREEGKLCGDVDPAVERVAGYLTPVPGGVGPMTITMLMKNTVKAATMFYE